MAQYRVGIGLAGAGWQLFPISIGRRSSRVTPTMLNLQQELGQGPDRWHERADAVDHHDTDPASDLAEDRRHPQQSPIFEMRRPGSVGQPTSGESVTC